MLEINKNFEVCISEIFVMRKFVSVSYLISLKIQFFLNVFLDSLRDCAHTINNSKNVITKIRFIFFCQEKLLISTNHDFF